MKLERTSSCSDEFECFLDIPGKYSIDVDTRHNIYLQKLGIFTKQLVKKLNVNSDDIKIFELINYTSMLKNHRILSQTLNILKNKYRDGMYNHLNDFDLLYFEKEEI